MERDPLAQVAWENFFWTYLRLAATVAGATVVRPPGLVAVESEVSHPIGNFALLKDEHQVDVGYVADRANAPFPYRVYTPGEVGFLPCMSTDFRLQLMAAPPSGVPTEPDEDAGRFETARFIADTVFGRYGPDFVGRVSQGLANDLSFRLLGIAAKGRVVAAALVSETEDSAGLYNLFVRPPDRKRGLATCLLARARSLGLPCVLQCNHDLVPWYERRGFQHVGELNAFTWDSA